MSTALLGSGYDYSPVAVLVLVVLVVSFTLPGLLLASVTRSDPKAWRATAMMAEPPTWLLLLGAVVASVGVARLGADVGMSVFNIRSLGELFDIGQENAAAVFQGEHAISAATSAALAVFQAAIALTGVRLVIRPSRSTYALTGYLLFLALLSSTFTTQRSYLLVPIVWFIAGYVAALVASGRRGLSRRTLALSFLSGIILLALIVFLRAVRTAGSGAELSESTWAPTRLWLASYVPTFSSWYNASAEGPSDLGLLNGVVALVGPLLGMDVADDSYGFHYVGLGSWSNAGTVMIRVAGPAGATWGAVTLIILGMLAHFTYERTAQGRPLAATLYIGVLSAIFWSINSWFFGYGSRVLALALLLLAGVIAANRFRIASGAATSRAVDSPTWHMENRFGCPKPTSMPGPFQPRA